VLETTLAECVKTADKGSNRRGWILQVLKSAAALGIPSVFHAEQAHQHASPQSAPQGHWSPAFFNAEQNETLTVLGERIIPGSTEAFCNRVIDLIMTVESEKNRSELVKALADFDAEAQSRYQKSYRALPREMQDAVLTDASHENARLHSQFLLVKEWMADTYWSSQNGIRELGSTGQLAWPSFPGCDHPGKHS
jgi:gluconate 2-dehydrogenase subunit 3-like protein